MRRYVLCQLLCVFVRDEKTGDIDGEEVPIPGSPPALTVIQSKVFTLIHLLEGSQGFGGFVDQFIQFSHFRLLGGEQPMRRMKTSQLVNLSRILTAIWKSRGKFLWLEEKHLRL